MKKLSLACYRIAAILAANSGIILFPLLLFMQNVLDMAIFMGFGVALPAVWYILALSLDRLTGD